MVSDEQYETRQESFLEWKNDNLQDLKVEFVEKQPRQKLNEFIISETEESFHDWIIDEFEQYCEERYKEVNHQ